MATSRSPNMTGIPSPPSYPPPAPPQAPSRAPPEPPLPAQARTPLTIPPLTPPVEAFFTRCGFPPTAARDLCWEFVDSHYPSASGSLTVYECPNQGYCSYTLCLDDSHVVQFRPRAHQLNTTLALLAREVYGVLAPETRFLGVLPIPSSSDGSGLEPAEPLAVYSMTCMPGVSLTDFRRNAPLGDRSAAEVRLQRAILIRDFARFLALGWTNRLPPPPPPRPASREGANPNPNPNPNQTPPTPLPFRGRLAGSLRPRLEALRDKLPPRFRPVAADVLRDLPRIEALPWVLTHGDVVPDNVMVEPGNTGQNHRGTGWWPGTLRGLLDWAESEYLPFGVGLYGAEELLGQTVRRWGSDCDGQQPRSRFAYYAEAGDLRRLFWQELEGAVPPLATDRELRAAVEQARVLGILLWHGFAFDDGKIDRVVEEGRDEAEVQRLDMFLFGSDHPLAKGDADLRVAMATEKEGWRKEAKKPLVTVAEPEAEKERTKGRGYLSRRISNMIL